MNNRNYTGPNAAGVPKNQVPDWLDHTTSAKQNSANHDHVAPNADPGPNANGAVGQTAQYTG